MLRRCETRRQVKSSGSGSAYRTRPIIEALRPDAIPAFAMTLKRTSSRSQLFTVASRPRLRLAPS